MPVHFLDKKIPEGYSPEDLGESSSGISAHLISLLSSPLIHRRANIYVVFITDGDNVDEYRWSIKNTTDETEELTTTTKEGKLIWKSKKLQKNVLKEEYSIQVTIIRDNTELEILELNQTVEQPKVRFSFQDRLDKGNIAGLKSHFIRGYVGGSNLVFKRIFYDFFKYISAEGDIDSAVAPILYSRIKTKGSKTSESLNLYTPISSDRIKESRSNRGKAFLFNANRLRGIARLDPTLVAYWMDYIGSNTKEEIEAEAIKNPKKGTSKLRKAYEDLEETQKIDITNLLRFPKSNISILKNILEKLKLYWENENLANPELEKVKDIALERKIKVLGTFIDNFGTPFSKINEKNEYNTNSAGTQASKSYKLTLIKIFFFADEEIKTLMKEWEEADEEKVKKHFNVGVLHYILISRFYKKGGEYVNPIEQPLSAWIEENIEWVTFLGHKIPVNKELVATLQKIEEKLKDKPYRPYKIWGFTPRLIASQNQLSNHSTGKGLDVDHPTNPMLYKSHLEILEIMLDIELFGTKLTFIETQQLNDKFLQLIFKFESSEGTRTFLIKLEDLINDKRKEEEKKPKKKQKTKEQISSNLMDAYYKLAMLQKGYTERNKNKEITFHKKGIMTLPDYFVSAMKEEGFTWGGNWEGSKDFMHFDKE